MAKRQQNRQRKIARNKRKQKARKTRSRDVDATLRRELRLAIEEEVDYALGHLEEGNSGEARRILKELRRKFPGNAHVNYGLGVLHAILGEHDKALPFFDKAVQIKPNFVEAVYNLAVTHKQRLDIPPMIRAYRRVVDIGEPGAYAVREAKGMLEMIERSVREHNSISLDEYLEANERFDEGFEEMRAGNYEAAIELFEEALAIDAKSPQSYGNMGVCYMGLGKKARALECLDRALELDPMYEPALVNRKSARAMREGERLEPGKINVMQYYKDYALEGKSYVRELVDEQDRRLPGGS